MLMVKPKGGRGVSAPYKTTHVRVPVPLKDEVSNLIEAWHNSQNAFDSEEGLEKSEDNVNRLLDDPDLVIAIAHEILKKKKSARVSIELLIRAIFGEEIKL